jgi:hypothetical protein
MMDKDSVFIYVVLFGAICWILTELKNKDPWLFVHVIFMSMIVVVCLLIG